MKLKRLPKLFYSGDWQALQDNKIERNNINSYIILRRFRYGEIW
jgi:hypothetical protein